MGLRFELLCINAAEVPEGLFQFWAAILEPSEGTIRPDQHGSHPGVNRPPYPFFTPTPDSSVENETRRAVELGATILGKFHTAWDLGWVELADPSGTMFAIGSAEPDDVETLISTAREATTPFWTDAENQWNAKPSKSSSASSWVGDSDQQNSETVLL